VGIKRIRHVVDLDVQDVSGVPSKTGRKVNVAGTRRFGIGRTVYEPESRRNDKRFCGLVQEIRSPLNLMSGTILDIEEDRASYSQQLCNVITRLTGLERQGNKPETGGN